MPARTVPKNYRNLTGLVYNSRTRSLSAFESTLERDYLLLLDFDLAVEFYEEQPATIEYRDSSGSLRRYTPDVFVRYRSTVDITPVPLCVLCEVKYRDHLRLSWGEYKPRFKAARRYAREHGWRFRLITEREIRTPYLANIKFLRQYQDLAVDNAQQSLLLQTLAKRPETDVEGLVAAMTEDRWHQARWLPVLWHLIAQRRVGVNLKQPLTQGSRLWLNGLTEGPQ